MNTTTLKHKYYVGVSGHRDLKITAIEAYKTEIKERLQSIAEAQPDKEVIILSPLAEGADRLMVYAAKELGLRYEVLLPMPKALYEMDFDASSLREFRALYYEARRCDTVGLCETCTLENISTYSKERDAQYRKVGEEVVNRCDEVFFLWDGVQNGLKGGTADIYSYAEHKNKSRHWIQCERENAKGDM